MRVLVGLIMADTLQKMQAAKSLREKLTAWDAKLEPTAALTERQKDSFMELNTQSCSRPFPFDLPVGDEPRTPQTSVSEQSGDAGPFNIDKIENAQQFFLWFSDVEDAIQSEQEYPQREFVSGLAGQKSECDHMVDEVTTALGYLDDLKDKYIHVSTKTNALHEACENLLDEQTKLVNMAESINTKLAYFNELERISSKLGSPTLTVTSDSFVPMLSRLDECLAYLNKHPQYKESGVYMTRFKQALSRALNLIKIHVTTILQNATQQVLTKKNLKQQNLYLVETAQCEGMVEVEAARYEQTLPTPSPSIRPVKTAGTQKELSTITTDAFTLLYGKFRANAPRVKSLMEQIEQRLDKAPEYEQLLVDCQQCYFAQRMALLGASVYRAVTELATKHNRDHCALVRSGCAFMVHVCQDEYTLFTQFFSRETSLLDEMLESLCGNLYDVLRPLIIHVNHLETLAELCSILKMEMIEEHVRHNSEQLGAFETICNQMLQDVQERFVYRTYIYIRQEILNYAPADGDLAYPDKLQMMEEIAESLKKGLISQKYATSRDQTPEIVDENGEKVIGFSTMEPLVTVPLQDAGPGGNMPMSPADLHGMWYPTVRRTLVCLSKLYRCIDRQTFQGLSQETLTMCISSLLRASEAISKKKSLLDSHLFLIKHLLILREQIAPFHVDFAIKEMALDFSKIKDAAFNFVGARRKLFQLNSSNAVLNFILEGTPQVTETFVDSKKEVDNQLKKSCENFIQYVSQQLIGSLKTFLDKCDVVFKMKEDPSAPQVELRKQPFASPEKVQEVVAETYKNLKNRKTSVQTSMALYLANKDTEYILFKPIKSNVQQCFQRFTQILNENFSEEDQQIIGSPSLEQINLLLASVPPKPPKIIPIPRTSSSSSGLDTPQPQTPTTPQAMPSLPSQPVTKTLKLDMPQVIDTATTATAAATASPAAAATTS